MKIEPKTILAIEPTGFGFIDPGDAEIDETSVDAEIEAQKKREVGIAEVQVELKKQLPELLTTPLNNMFKKDYAQMKAPTKLVAQSKEHEEIGLMMQVVWRCGLLIEKQGRKTSRISKLTELLVQLENGSQSSEYSQSFIRELRKFINKES